MFSNTLKSCIHAAFLISSIFISQARAETNEITRIANTPIWLTLIHSWHSNAQISDASFLLSLPNYSAANELTETLALIKSDSQAALCRFPARVTYLANALNIQLTGAQIEHCLELQKFINHVPFDALDVVYASEVLSSASSMMGHIFLKASGVNFKGNLVEHSLAYFTEIDTLNPAKLIVDSTIKGMPGFFSVRPFHKDKAQYRDTESRNLWQFKLDLSSAQKTLIQYHLWELNQINMTYYFQSFNCATLTLELLALAKPNIMSERSIFVSPADIVKAVLKHKMVLETNVSTSPIWLFSALNDTIDPTDKKLIDQALQSGPEHIADKALLKRPLVYDYARTVIENSKPYKSTHKHNPKITNLPNEKTDRLDFSNYKHPALTPQDSGIGLSYSNEENADKIKLHWLPTGHFIHGDNRQYLSESELTMGNTTLEVDLDTGAVNIEELSIYSVKSYGKDNPYFPMLSGEFYIGYRPSYNKLLDNDSLLEISGAIGKTMNISKDISGFLLVGTGLTSDIKHSQWFVNSKSGVIIDLIGNLKLIASYEVNSGKAKQTNGYHSLDTHISWFPSQNSSITLSLSRVKTSQLQHQKLGLQYIKYF
ncbi:lipoprotein N-acyltransferase Lnb domain-containing protein [Pseudoalteromonas aurantia]|uniref:DUF4105 domain-containing protein n=1 Tax=Pseudoalteromonas aurantia 208 TaxID=1314867 RepID=A0ABR9EJE0_9GAMM|nr:DUF4105 domain-containing protein [Pseudoalteromonas aurantia]MBE0371125.1 hypothetical protein [Pseudoalteromonas aurantia 208]